MMKENVSLEVIRNRKLIDKAKKKKVKCDVCLKLIKAKKFKVIQIWNTDRVDKFFHKFLTNCEKEIIVCDDCIDDLNFREVK